MNFPGVNFGQMAAHAAQAAGKGSDRMIEDDKDTKRERGRNVERDLFKGKAIEQDRKPKGNEKSYLA